MKTRQLLLALAVILVGFAVSAQAQNVTWTGTAGDLLWTTPGNWDSNVPGLGDLAVIGGGVGPINLGGNQSVGGLAVTGGGSSTLGDVGTADVLTIAADGLLAQVDNDWINLSNVNWGLTFAGDATIQNNSPYSGISLNGAITGAGTVTFASTEPWTGVPGGQYYGTFVNGDNSGFTGNWVINGGSVKFANDAALGNAASITVNGGAFFFGSTGKSIAVNGNAMWLGNADSTMSGTLTIAAGATLQYNDGGGNPQTVSGAIAGDGDIQFNHNPTWPTNTINGSVANTLTGKTILASGQMTFQKDAGVDAVAGSALVVKAGATGIWGASDQIKDTTNLELAGGKLQTAGFNETAGTVSLSGIVVTDPNQPHTIGTVSTVDLGAASTLAFANSSAATWDGSLVLQNVGTGSVSVGSDATGLTSAQLAQIAIKDPASSTGFYTAAIDSAGKVAATTTEAQAPRQTLTGTIWNPNNELDPAYGVRLMGDSTFGWQTGTTSYDVDTNGFTFTMNTGGGNPFEYAGAISGSGDVRLESAGAGSYYEQSPIILSGPNPSTSTGKYIIATGVVQMNKPAGVTAISGNIEIGGQGDNDRLQWMAADQVADTASVKMIGTTKVTLDLNGNSETLGTLDLQATKGIVDLGAGASVLHFADSSAVAWAPDATLKILNWSGSATDQVFFGTTSSGLTTAQLAQVSFVDPTGYSAGTYGAKIGATGELTPLFVAGIDSTWNVDANGNWTVDGNWTAGAPANGNTSIARFGSVITAARTVTVDAPATVNQIIFDNATASYTVAGSTITLGGVIPTVQVISGSHEISAPLAGIAGLTKTGAGALTVSGANTYSGDTNVSAGTLKFAGTNALPDTAGTMTVAAGATGEFAGSQNAPTVSLVSNTATSTLIMDAGAHVTVGAATIGSGSTLTTGAGSKLTLGSNDAAVTLNTVATGTGTIALVGNAANKTLTSLGAAFDGNIEITASPAYVGNPDANTFPVAVTAGGINAFGSAVGTTTVTNLGSGMMAVKGIPSSATTPLAENFIINAGSGVVAFTPAASKGTFSGNVQINSGILRLDNGGYWTFDTGVISGAGMIDVINPGDILTGANTFSGGVRVGTGTAWSGVYGITQGITVGGSDTVVGGAIQSGPLGTGTLTFDVATSNWNGTGRVADNGQATTVLHNNVVQRNAINIASQANGAVANNANTMIFTDAGLTTPSTWTLQPCPNVWSNATPAPGLAGTNGSQLPLIMGINVNTNYTAEIDQVIRQNMGATSGNMTLRKIGAGTLILGRNNTYGGDTMAMQGTLKLGTNNALPTGGTLALGGGVYVAADWPELGLVPSNGVSVNFTGNTAYGTFDLNGYNQTVGGIGQSSDSVIPANNIVTNSNVTTASTFTINNAVNNTFKGTFSGNLNIVKNGAGALTLVAQPTVKTTVQNGALILTGNVTTPTLAVNGGGLILKTADLATTVAQIKTAYGSGTWASTGLTSTTGAAGTGLGVDTAANLGLTTFQGQTVDPTDVLVKYTWLGDADMNGVVNFSDFLKLQAGYGKPAQTWANGDFNYDGSVNFSDFLLLQAAYGKPALSETVATVSVPEPATLSLLALGGLALLGRKSRKA